MMYTLTQYIVPTLALPCPAGTETPLSAAPFSGGAGSDDEKTIHELRDMLTTSMTIRDQAEKDRMVGASKTVFEGIHTDYYCS